MSVSLLVLSVSADGANPLELRVSPRVAYAPADVWLTTAVEPHADNRRLRVEADSGNYYRSSEFDLAGVDAARTQAIEWVDLPVGEYVIRATLFGPGGSSRATDEETVRLIGIGGQ